MISDDATRWVEYAAIGGCNALLAATLVTAVALIAAACTRRRPVLRYGLLCSFLATLVAAPLFALVSPVTGYSSSLWNNKGAQAPPFGPVTTGTMQPHKSLRATPVTTHCNDANLITANAPSNAAAAMPSAAGAAVDARRLRTAGPSQENGLSLLGDSPSSIREQLGAAVRAVAGWFLTLWIAGALVGFVQLAIACRCLNSVVREAHPLAGDAAAVLVECRRQLGIKRDIVLVASDRASSPFATGIHRAWIVLPSAWAARASREHLRTVLLHEAAHIVRRDPAVVLVQQVMAACYWFHPLVWLFNSRLAVAREETCDNYVLEAIDAPAYSRMLLSLAEILQPLRPLPATAGLFASRWRLERRIAGLLDDRRDRATRLAPHGKAIVCVLAVAATAGAALMAGTLARGQSPDQNAGTTAPAVADAIDTANKDVPPIEAIAKAAAAAERTLKSIESVHVRYRQTLMTGPFKPGTSPKRCDELLGKYDLVTHPESLRDLLAEILATETVASAPWSEKELHIAHPGTSAEKVRDTRHSPKHGPDVHVVTPEISMRWDEANSQLNVDAPQENRYGYTRLDQFWTVTRPEMLSALGGIVTRDIVDGRPVLRIDHAGSVTLVDAETGFLLDTGSLLSVDRGPYGVARRHRWLGWYPTPGGERFPKATIELEFDNGQLRMIGAILVDNVQFNPTLSPATFTLGAPAGSVVVDSRKGRDGAVRINRDVFDASSADQVNEATNPLSEEPTPTELAAFDDLREMYNLSETEALRRLGPPYPLSRNYLMRLLRPHATAQRRGTPNSVIEWKDGKLGELRTFYDGSPPTFAKLIGTLLHQSPADIDIPPDVLSLKLPGDYLVRSDAARDQLAAALSTTVSQELGRPIHLEFREAAREVYVARGTLTLKESSLRKYSDRPLIAVNGGTHDGDHGEVIGFGDISRLLNELSEYIDVKIVNETTPSDRALAWSKRWYDLDATPASQRFRLDRQRVLDLVSQQTGVTFELQTRKVNVLTLAKP